MLRLTRWIIAHRRLARAGKMGEKQSHFQPAEEYRR
jgi:hypothetical protein